MGKYLLVLSFILTLLSYSVNCSDNFQPQPLLMFDHDSPYYESADQKVVQMLDLLADIPQSSKHNAVPNYVADGHRSIYQLPSTSKLEGLPHSLTLEKNNPYVYNYNVPPVHLQGPIGVYQSSRYGQAANNNNWPAQQQFIEEEVEQNHIDSENDDDVHKDDSYMGMLRSVISKTTIVTKSLKNIVDTVIKVARIYKDQKAKILNNSTILSRMGIENRTIKYDPNNSITTTLLNVILDPPSIEKMIEVGQTAENEDEILTGLTAILLGSEARSSGYGSSGYGGTALTLDPVTIIALLTLGKNDLVAMDFLTRIISFMIFIRKSRQIINSY